jgi:hypothetical protein
MLLHAPLPEGAVTVPSNNSHIGLPFGGPWLCAVGYFRIPHFNFPPGPLPARRFIGIGLQAGG